MLIPVPTITEFRVFPYHLHFSVSPFLFSNDLFSNNNYYINYLKLRNMQATRFVRAFASAAKPKVRVRFQLER